MANDRKNIEDVFKALEDFKVKPQTKVWEGLEKELIPNKKPIAWFTFRYAVGFIALLFVGLVILLNVLKLPIESEAKNSFSYQNIVKQYLFDFSLLNSLKVEQVALQSHHNLDFISSSQNSKKTFDAAIDSQNRIAKETVVNTTSEKENESLIASQTEDSKASEESGFFNALYQLSFQKEDFEVRLQTMHLKDLSLASNKNQLIKEQIASQIKNENEEASTLDEVEKRSLLSRFSVTPGVSPVFSGSNSATSFAKGAGEASQGTTNLSFGLQVAYSVTDKLSLRTGVHQIGSGYQTSNLAATYQSNSNQIATIATFAEANLIFMDTKTFSEMVGPNSRVPYSETSLNHELGFLEIPMEASYQLIDQKIGFSIIGGMSTLLLNENRIIADFQDDSFIIGSANNINSTSFSANFGLGFNYQFTEKIKFNIEPNLRYQINTFDSATTNFKPYMIGVFSGIKFEF